MVEYYAAITARQIVTIFFLVTFAFFLGGPILVDLLEFKAGNLMDLDRKNAGRVMMRRRRMDQELILSLLHIL